MSCFGFQVSGFRFRVSGFGFQVSCFGFQISGFGFRGSSFGFQVSGFGVRVSSCEESIQDLSFPPQASPTLEPNIGAIADPPSILAMGFGARGWTLAMMLSGGADAKAT